MAWPKDHKDKKKVIILESASQLFARQGFKKVTIDQVMNNAGLTRGIFYTYFKNKADLYQQSIVFSAQSTVAEINKNDNITLAEIASTYIDHNSNPDKRVKCPLASLVNDITTHEPIIRQTYSTIFKKFVKHIEDTGLSNQEAIQASIMLIGTVAVSNAVDDVEMRQAIISAAKLSF